MKKILFSLLWMKNRQGPRHFAVPLRFDGETCENRSQNRS
jgi:hypothetical protein